MSNLFSAQNLYLSGLILAILFVSLNLFLLICLILLKQKPEIALVRFFVWIRKHYLLLEVATVFLLIGVVALNLALSPKVISPSEPSLSATEVSNLKPVEVVFSHPIKGWDLKYQISPDLPGEWKIDNGYLGGRGKLIFTPSESPLLETRYTISLKEIKNIFSRSSSDYLFSFETLAAPVVEKVSLVDGDQGVLPDQKISITTGYFPAGTSQFEFEVIPALELSVENSGQSYIIKAKDKFQKGASYSLKIYRTLISKDYKSGQIVQQGEKKEITSLSFKIIDAPGVKATSPSGSGVLVNTPIEIEYAQDMDKESVENAFTISPRVEGNFSWQERKLIYTPKNDLSKNTNYSITVAKTSQTAGGETMEEDITFSFMTIGYVSVSKFFPANGASGVALDASISVTFNQDVDHASAESKFSINPAITGNFSWSGNTMSFRHGAFLSSTKYTVTVATGVKSINGLDSNNAFSSTFTTKIPATTINVPSYKQAHMYSCMAVAARNALAFKGVSVSESSVLSRIGYDTTAWSGTWAEGGAVWGDPDAGIVGDIDGKANNIGWGYGSHWTPVANAINSFGRTAEIKTGWDVNGIAAEIAAGNPVIVWWVNGVWPAYVVNWQTPGGKSVRAVNSMHVQVVKGFTGTTDNPLSFTVTDSGYGYPSQTFDTATFKAKWSWFSNTAVVVR